MRGIAKDLLPIMTEDFHCISDGQKEIFSMVRLNEIHNLTADLPVDRLKTIATDGPSLYFRSLISEMDEETYELWVKFHLCTCERPDLIGATNHSLDILQKCTACSFR